MPSSAEESVLRDLSKLNVTEAAEGRATMADLPDEVLLKIFKWANVGVGLQLRLDRRMQTIVHSLLRDEEIELQIEEGSYTLLMRGVRGKIDKEDFEGVFTLLTALKQWTSSNNEFSKIYIKLQDEMDENIAGAIFDLCQCNTDLLEIFTERVPVFGSSEKIRPTFHIPQLEFGSLLVMAANVRDVYIDSVCSSLTGMDLCILWKTLGDGDSKMQSFAVGVNPGVVDAFAKAALGVTIVKTTTWNDASTVCKKTVEYKCEPKIPPHRLFSNTPKFPANVYHFSPNVKTLVGERDEGEQRVHFKRVSTEEKASEMERWTDIELNMEYETTIEVKPS